MRHGTICIPVAAATNRELRTLLARCGQEPADLVELRLDTLDEPAEVEGLLAAAPLPCIATCRPVREGGAFDGPEEERLALLRRAAAAGAAYVDVERDSLAAAALPPGPQIIASFHDFARTPGDLSVIAREMAALPCDIVKFATMAVETADNLRVWDALRNCPKPAIGLAMGELGEVSRVLAPRLGSLLTFGALEAGRESAPGQLTARDLAELYRVRTITDATALYAVVGDPVAHSVSPEIHNTAFRETGLDAAYLRFRVADLAAFLATVRPLALQGLSVTIPHKQAALAASAEVDPLARQAGAVNTLTRTPQGWRGENTDIYGALQALSAAAREGGIELAGAPALLLGAGGAARGIACALQEAGCRLTIANRTAERAARLAEEFGAEAVELADAHRGRYAVVANSTSVGMHPHEEATPIAAEVFGPGMVAFDAVYNPRETRMLREARERGAAIADGVAMFVGQAVRQFELWTGRAAPVAAMERVVVERLTR